MSNSHYVVGTLCDDIRIEVGNKHSFMGIYRGQMIIQSFPTLLPRLCFIADCRAPIGQPFRELSVICYLNDAIIARYDFHSEVLEQAADTSKSVVEGDVDDKEISLVAMMGAVPLQLPSPGWIRIRCETNVGELKGGSWQIVSAS